MLFSPMAMSPLGASASRLTVMETSLLSTPLALVALKA